MVKLFLLGLILFVNLIPSGFCQNHFLELKNDISSELESLDIKQRLIKIENLDNQLHVAIKNPKDLHFALQVIRILNKEEFINSLVESIQFDKTGEILGTISYLFKRQTHKVWLTSIEKIALKLDKNFSNANRISLLTIYQKFNILPKAEILWFLLNSKVYNVRLLTVDLFKTQKLNRLLSSQKLQLIKAFDLPPVFLRRKIVDLFLSYEKNELKSEILKKCMKDKNDDLQRYCKEKLI